MPTQEAVVPISGYVGLFQGVVNWVLVITMAVLGCSVLLLTVAVVMVVVIRRCGRRPKKHLSQFEGAANNE